LELREALAQISEIHAQIARTEVFRGYRSFTVALSGLFAVGAAVLQPLLVPLPAADVGGYLKLWVGAALASMAAAGAEMWHRARQSRSPMARRLTWLAIEQFLPCVAAGFVATAAIVAKAVELAWILPGLWFLLFGLGIFASFRLLPRQVFFVGVYYLACGGLCLGAGPERALQPWTMGLSFGVGQLFAATILYFTLEQAGLDESMPRGGKSDNSQGVA
jgi:hypothetical protein